VAGAVAAGAVPHHSFHVLAVYPWLGLLRSGVVDEPLHVLDRCRTTPALVMRADGDSLLVLARPLEWDGRALSLGAFAPRIVRWRDGGLALVERPESGAWVSLHWDFACDRLDDRAARSLDHWTRRVLAAVNGSRSTAHALA
jgi:hypothetical protein